MTKQTQTKQVVLKRQKCEVYSRIVGYIRPTSSWHVGKQEEFKAREVFVI